MSLVHFMSWLLVQCRRHKRLQQMLTFRWLPFLPGMSKTDGTLWACGRNLHGQLGSCEAAQEDAVATLYQVAALAKVCVPQPT